MRPNLSEGIYPNNSAALSIEFCLTYRDIRKDWRNSTMKKRIITISREFGSGGHSIGKIVAETLGIGF